MENSINPDNTTFNPNVDSNINKFLNALNSSDGPALETLSPQVAREVIGGLQASVQTDLGGITVTEREIQSEGLHIKLFVIKPVGAGTDIPVFMYFHGGGWVLGNLEDHQRLVRDLVITSGAAAVFVEYPLSPEVRYPVAINQAYAATKWVAENGAEIGVDGKRLAVAGNSAGGNMATVVSLLAKEKLGPEIKSQLLLWPITDANFQTGSYDQFATGHYLTRDMMRWFWDNYTSDDLERTQIYASPLKATLEQLKGLPPALILTAENDVLRDEGEAYARKLNEAGVPVVSVRFNGMIHDWSTLNVLTNVPGAGAAILLAASDLKLKLGE